MDPDSGSESNYKDVFVDCSTIKPEISFQEKSGIKYFDTASMIDDTDSFILSSAAFDSDYNFLHGEVCVIRLDHEEYYGIKKAIGKEINLIDMVNYRFNPAEVVMLSTGPNGRKYEKLVGDEVVETSYYDTEFSDMVLEDRQLSSTIDYMNNYLIRYGTCRGLSVGVFKSFEQQVQVINGATFVSYEQARVKKKAKVDNEIIVNNEAIVSKKPA